MQLRVRPETLRPDSQPLPAQGYDTLGWVCFWEWNHLFFLWLRRIMGSFRKFVAELLPLRGDTQLHCGIRCRHPILPHSSFKSNISTRASRCVTYTRGTRGASPFWGTRRIERSRLGAFSALQRFVGHFARLDDAAGTTMFARTALLATSSRRTCSPVREGGKQRQVCRQQGAWYALGPPYDF